MKLPRHQVIFLKIYDISKYRNFSFFFSFFFFYSPIFITNENLLNAIVIILDEGDTVIFPLLEMGPFNIHTDSHVTNKLLEKCDENFNLHLTTGYFNLTESYVNTIIHKSKADFKILMAHPTVSSFKFTRT